MYGDLSRDSFHSCSNDTRVIMQQGRPLTDADWNEQAAINERRFRDLARWSIDHWHGTRDGGFIPRIANNQLTLGKGTYIVDGLVCHLDDDCVVIRDVAAFMRKRFQASENNPVICVELVVNEHSVNPAMRSMILEPALRGMDTAWRSAAIWKVELRETNKTDVPSLVAAEKVKGSPCEMRNCGNRPLQVRRRPRGASSEGACELPQAPSASAAERLYRIEIHRGGTPADLSSLDGKVEQKKLDANMRFKWARDNGSTVLAVEPPASDSLKLPINGYRSKVGPTVGDWLELRDQCGRSVEPSRMLLRATGVDSDALSIERPSTSETIIANHTPEPDDRHLEEDPHCSSTIRHHVVAWHHRGSHSLKDGLAALTKKETYGDNTELAIIWNDGAVLGVSRKQGAEGGWIDLEGGIQIRFDASVTYEEGDSWLLRTTAFSESGFVDVIPVACEKQNPRIYSVRLQNFRKVAVIGASLKSDLASNSQSTKLSFEGLWRGAEPPLANGQVAAQPADGCGLCVPLDPDAPNPTPPSPQPISPTPTEANPDVNVSVPQGLLNNAGYAALSRYLSASHDVTRQVPARYLNHEPRSPSYQRFRAALLVSDILEPTFDKYFAKVERCLTLTDDNRPAVVQDAEIDYRLATELRKLGLSGPPRAGLIS